MVKHYFVYVEDDLFGRMWIGQSTTEKGAWKIACAWLRNPTKANIVEEVLPTDMECETCSHKKTCDIRREVQEDNDSYCSLWERGRK